MNEGAPEVLGHVMQARLTRYLRRTAPLGLPRDVCDVIASFLGKNLRMLAHRKAPPSVPAAVAV